MTTVTYCAVCDGRITIHHLKDNLVLQHDELETDGSLKYIQLAHRSCAETDNENYDYDYWT